MAETLNGGTSSNPPKEMSMEVRLLLAFLLMGAVMFVTPYLFKTLAPPAPATVAHTTAPAASEPAKPATETAKPAVAQVASAAPTAPATPTQSLPPLVIDTNLFRVTFSNQGANVRSWQLKKFKGNDEKPLELVNTASGLHFPFSLYFPGQKPSTDVNWAWYKQTADPDGLGVTYQFSDGHTVVRKSFRFQKDSYLSRVSTSVAVDGQPVPNMIEWLGGFGDLTVANASSNSQTTLYYNLADNKLVEESASSAKKGPLSAEGDFSFAGIADKYFAAVFLPEGGHTVKQVTMSDTVRTPLEAKAAAFTGVAVSDGAQNRFQLFVGPKDLKLLTQIDPKLTQVVNFGWFSILAKPLFLVVSWFNYAFVHNFGWAIVLVTIAINMLLFPIKISNMKSMRKMQALKPQIDAINARFKNLKMTDPKKQEQQQETMELYKKYGVNPMGGCIPMLIQIPFFYAFYKVCTVAVEMRGAHWLWVTDLSQPETLAIHVLPIIMIVSQFIMQKMTPQATGGDPNQQKMMMMMPLIFGFMFYNLSSGLVLYYLTSNLVGIGQQWFFNHTELAEAAARSVEVPKPKKNGRK